MANNLQLIVILAGGMQKDSNGVWRTTNFDENGDNFGVLGDRLRVIAAYNLYKDDPTQLIISSGGRGQMSHIADAPPVSSVIKRELVELGVPVSAIVEESNSGNTYMQLLELKNIVQKMHPAVVKIITNQWHLLRVKTMLNCYNNLKDLFSLSQIELVAAEDVLLNCDRKNWEELIKNAYNSPMMKERIELEKRGAEQIKNGTYKLSFS